MHLSRPKKLLTKVVVVKLVAFTLWVFFQDTDTVDAEVSKAFTQRLLLSFNTFPGLSIGDD